MRLLEGKPVVQVDRPHEIGSLAKNRVITKVGLLWVSVIGSELVTTHLLVVWWGIKGACSMLSSILVEICQLAYFFWNQILAFLHTGCILLSWWAICKGKLKWDNSVLDCRGLMHQGVGGVESVETACKCFAFLRTNRFVLQANVFCFSNGLGRLIL